MQIMKMASKARLEELEETNKKLKDENLSLKQKIFELQEQLSKLEKSRFDEKNLIEEI